MTGVRVENTGSVRTIVLHRPEARNAVDRPTADALFAAFDDFDQDDSASVAVFWGEGGAFCAGADLKAIGGERSNQMANPQKRARRTGAHGAVANVAV